MNKTKIEWCDYTINPVKGLCPMACPYCYARRMYKRFKWNPEIRFERQVMRATYLIQKQPERQRIFIGSTMELFGDWVKPEWMQYILGRVASEKWNDFIFLTKQPQNLAKWSPFPPNCWIGVSVDGTDNAPLGRIIYTGFDKIQASVKFISFEPLLQDAKLDCRDLGWTGTNWVIIGSQTQPTRHPDKAWVTEIIDAAERAGGIPVFVKEPLASHMNIHRQEYSCQQGR